MGTKCQYSICEEGNICFDVINANEFHESTESGLVITLGIFACSKLNLVYLEKHNLMLEGMNQYLAKEFSFCYNAYTKLSEKYGFDRTIHMGFDMPIEANEIYHFLNNLMVEKCNEDLTK